MTQSISRGTSAVDARVLVLGGQDGDPCTEAWQSELRRLGLMYELVSPSALAPISYTDLIHQPGYGRYNAIVMAADSSNFLASIEALSEYQREFAVRQIAGFEYPRPQAGLDDPYGRDLGGEQAQLTALGRRVFSYLNGPIPIDSGSFGYLARSVDESIFTPLLSLSSGEPVIGITVTPDGAEELVVTVNYADALLHWQLLSRGLLTWVTRGVHLGLGRHHLSCHVDDVFLASAPPGAAEDSPTRRVRMTSADVEAVLEWQENHDFVLDLAYNGAGAATTDDDPLTTTLLRHRNRFRWLNHTWDHLDLGPSTRVDDGQAALWVQVNSICDQIDRNRSWATSVGIDASPTALVTGAHSGLDNPNMPVALRRSGISAIATDASVGDSEAAHIGPAAAVPRHPTNIATHASTWGDVLEDYNARYAGQVEPLRTPADFLATEARIILRHMLRNDPRPTFAHQANLTGDRSLLLLLEHALSAYRSHLADNTPVVSLTMDEVALELERRRLWQQALELGDVSAVIQSGDLHLTAGCDLDVPVTVPAGATVGRRTLRRMPFGEPYAGSASGWHHLPAGATTKIRLPVSELSIA